MRTKTPTDGIELASVNSARQNLRKSEEIRTPALDPYSKHPKSKKETRDRSTSTEKKLGRTNESTP